MRILVLCNDFPSPSFSDTLPIFYLIKHLSLLYDHEITLVSFLSDDTRYSSEVESFCSVETPIKSQMPKSVYGKLFRTAKNMLSIGNLSAKAKAGLHPNLLDYYYSPQMVRKIQSLLQKNKFDLVYCTRAMANYALNISLPKVVQPYDAVYEWHRQIYLRSKGAEKLIYGISYKMTRIYERGIYKKFDACLVVTQQDKDLLTSLCPQINCQVLPNGVDTEYFSPMDIQEEFPSLVFVSDMSGKPTIDNVLYFYDTIYPLIRKELPQVKLYLVGRNPAREITNLAADQSVVVTGYVDSVQPYLAKSSIFIAPMILGTGIKNKVLEAMAMGKCVVTTSIGAQGINAVSGEDLITTDDPKEFATWVIKLLKDKQLRKKLGDNARIIIESEYSWKKMAQRLDQILGEAVTGHEKR
jgi:glycosyltransferase involved in cell wall biosynthesis